MKKTRTNEPLRDLAYRSKPIKVQEADSLLDLARWIMTVPLVWLLIFGCSSLSTVVYAHTIPTNLTSNLQGDYRPWNKSIFYSMQGGFIEEIKRDLLLMDHPPSIFTTPVAFTDPFWQKEKDTSGDEVSTGTPSPSYNETVTVEEVTGTPATSSPTLSFPEEVSLTPTMSLTPSGTIASTSTASSTQIPTSSYTPTPSYTPSPSFTPSPTRTSSPTSTSTPSRTPSPTSTSTPSRTPSPTYTSPPTQSFTICDPYWNLNYDYIHGHTPYYAGNVFGFIVHAFPITGPETQVFITEVAIIQNESNPTTLTVNKINWYHTGMGSTAVNVGQNSNTVYVSTNLPFYACYAAGQCDHALYGGFIEVELDGDLNGAYDMEIMVNFPNYNKTCRVSAGVTTN